jgi:hypothetical protein
MFYTEWRKIHTVQTFCCSASSGKWLLSRNTLYNISSFYGAMNKNTAQSQFRASCWVHMRYS